MRKSLMIIIGILLIIWDSIMVVGIFEAMDHPFCVSGWFGISLIVSGFITCLYIFELFGGR